MMPFLPGSYGQNLNSSAINMFYFGDDYFTGAGSDCESCKTEEDWQAYYQQAQTTAAQIGEDAWGYTNKRLTRSIDEDGHIIFYLDGERMDLTQYSNGAHAAGSLLGDAVLIEGVGRFFKFLSNLIKGRPTETQLLKAVNIADKGGYSLAGRSLAKHGGREGSAFPKAIGNRESVNKQAEGVLINIMKSPGVKVNTTNHFKHGKVIEYMTPNGQGARFTYDGKKFIGF